MPRPMRVPFARLHPEAELPRRMSAQAAGLDLVACLGDGGRIELAPGGRALIPTGLAVALPPGYEGQVRPRSGLALRHGVTVLNAPGTIDADYRGELMVTLYCLPGAAPFTVMDGDRVAQLVVGRLAPVGWAEVADLGETERGAGGHGSTGVR